MFIILIKRNQLLHALIFLRAGKNFKMINTFCVNVMDGIIFNRTESFHGFCQPRGLGWCLLLIM